MLNAKFQGQLTSYDVSHENSYFKTVEDSFRMETNHLANSDNSTRILNLRLVKVI